MIDNSEEQYIEETFKSSEEKNKYLDEAKNILINKKKEELKQEELKQELNKIKEEKLNNIKQEKIKKIILKNKYKNIEFSSVPYNFINTQNQEKEDIETILKNEDIFGLLKKIEIIFYEEEGDVRGRMKNRAIKLFAPQNMKKDELIAIFIHEFSHYIDIYSLERGNYKDISNKFYDISWYSTKILNSGLTGKDFVSGYAMTNKYEDFAESLTYYILHNNDFLEKSKKSEILRKKYNFFSFYIFKNKLFQNTDFSEGNKIKNYYRDITKINFSLNNLLQYLKYYI
ncbi:MAG: putative zinc-binding metallopeptidase [Candidatus Gracilibacteria bacterium]|nr:putative zinc-binding metallopeptidase [Candidatus Gracilibacteria bacterium]MDQ7022617.1 putative zinc-binding metallopeptidase [Candidatus Gracilibacteria bacterium]